MCVRLSNWTENQWLQYDVGPPRQISGIVTRGHGGWEHRRHAAWVTSYTLSYSNDTLVWFSYRDGNHLDPKVLPMRLLLLGWKLSPVAFYHWLMLQNTTWLSFQANSWWNVRPLCGGIRMAFNKKWAQERGISVLDQPWASSLLASAWKNNVNRSASRLFYPSHPPSTHPPSLLHRTSGRMKRTKRENMWFNRLTPSHSGITSRSSLQYHFRLISVSDFRSSQRWGHFSISWDTVNQRVGGGG